MLPQASQLVWPINAPSSNTHPHLNFASRFCVMFSSSENLINVTRQCRVWGWQGAWRFWYAEGVGVTGSTGGCEGRAGMTESGVGGVALCPGGLYLGAANFKLRAAHFKLPGKPFF